MKHDYIVQLTKIKQYIIQAESYSEAENIAIELDSSKEADIAWIELPYDNIELGEGY